MTDNALGTYLRDRRAKLAPAALGFPLTRRRTPGLRREEVAQRANVSTTWYTWLEQGRGGAPSADVLDRIARAMMLTEIEREHLFLLGLGRPPEIRYRAAEGISPRLQRVLDAMEFSPAYVKNATWDIIAWNRAAAIVLCDYAALAPEERNSLRLLFCNSQIRRAMPNWESDARFVVAAFRADTTRTGAAESVKALVEELSRASAEFAAMWRDHDVRIAYGEAPKLMRHPKAGLIALDYSAFAVEGRPDLSMVVYSPAAPADAIRVRSLIVARANAAEAVIARPALRRSRR